MLNEPAPKEDGVAAVERALCILAAWRDGEHALPLRELHKRTGLYKSTILRLLASLERHGCVERQAGISCWALGPTLFHWGRLYQRGAGREPLISEHLNRLAGATGVSATFWVRNGTSRLCLFRADADPADFQFARPGDLRPVDQGVSGAVLIGGGHGLDDGVASGISCPTDEALAVSAPVFGSDGELRGAMTVFGSFNRMGMRLDRVRPMVRDAAASLSEALGRSTAA